MSALSRLLALSSTTKDLGGGVVVRRALPHRLRQSIGPFVFFDHFGPVDITPETNDVRPHPHIGLATVTYLFEGRIRHRDSLANDLVIEPGAINWMTAGSGIVHSERWAELAVDAPFTLHGLQLWAALPEAHEEAAPAFVHTPADAIPRVALPGAAVRVLIGEAFGARSPVATLAPTLYLDIALDAGAELALDAGLADEIGLYALDAGVSADGNELAPGVLFAATLGSGGSLALAAKQRSRLIAIGGSRLEHRRHLYWNFVSSRPERIDQAARDWDANRMGDVPGEDDRIPLPPQRAASQPL